MLIVQNSHQQYQKFVENSLNKLFILTNQHSTILENQNLILKFWNADFYSLIPILKPLYSSSKGRPSKDIVALFRFLLLMAEVGEASIPQWVKTLRSHPFYAIISGFVPQCLYTSSYKPLFNSLPGIGTFYDFMNKLIRSDKLYHKSKLKKIKRKPKKKQKKNHKANEPKSTLTERIVKRVLKYDNSKLPDSFESNLNTILKSVFVSPSLKSGLLGDVNKFNIAADGTILSSHTSPFGKKVCNCKLLPGQKCDCKRKFTDPDAAWGWDSYHEVYVFGHGFHTFTACSSKYDLPMHIKSVSAARHDAITGIYHLKEFVDSYPDIKIYSAAYDSAYDFNYFYLLNEHYGIAPVIELNKRSLSSKPNSSNLLVAINDNGIHFAKKCGKQLRNWGIIKKSFRRNWLFPAQCDNCNGCDIKSCNSYYQPLKANPRYSTRILRNSDQWKHIYKRRTTTERVWDRIKNDFNAEFTAVYSKAALVTRVFIGAFCSYVDAWAKESTLEISDVFHALARFAA